MTISKKKKHIASSLLATSLLAFGSIAISVPAMAEEFIKFTVEKEGEVSNSDIAFVPFAGDEAVSGMILDNLKLASIQATTRGLISNDVHSGTEVRSNLPTWQQLSIPYLVVGSTSGNTASFEVIELATGRSLSTKRDPSRTVHKISTNNRKDTATKSAARIYEIIKGKQSDLDAKIAYIEETGAGKNKTSSLFIRDADGGNPVELTRVTNASIFRPAASPNGRYIAYSVQFEKNHADLFQIDLMNPRAKPKKLVELKGSNLSPSYSPDGSAILFSNSTNGDSDIYIVSSQGGAARKVIDLAFQQVQPSYAPDGRSFYFGSDHANPGNISIYRSDFSNSPTRVSRSGAAANPNVSPDGTKIGYLNGSVARIMDTSGNNIASFNTGGLEEAPSISPSSERVVYPQGRRSSTLVIQSLVGAPTISRRVSGEVKSPIWVPSAN